jgi:AcrR family transcriptional regulator
MAVMENDPTLAGDAGLVGLSRTRILNVAAAAFAQKGFNGVTIRDLAARASVNLAAVNYHFGSKEGLYAAVIDAVLAEWTYEIVLVDELSADTSLSTAIRLIVSALISPVIEHDNAGLLPRLLAWDLLQQPTGATAKLTTPCLAAIERLLEPYFPKDLAHEPRALMARWLASQCLLLSVTSAGEGMQAAPDHAARDRLAEKVADMAMHGLAPILRGTPSP